MFAARPNMPAASSGGSAVRTDTSAEYPSSFSARPKTSSARKGAFAGQTDAECAHPRTASDVPLGVLFVSETLVAVNDDGTGAPTLTDLLRERIAAGSVPGVPAAATDELQALQRLDRDTTGIVLFSRCKRTQPLYDRLIAEHGFEKRYLAIARGRARWTERTLDGPIGRDRHDARRMRVSRTGKPARTHVRVLDARRIDGEWLTLLDVSLETGRKHQIRVHLAHEGLPLLGDALYGKPDPRGLMLHARELAFTDPVTSEPVRIVAPAPDRMRRLFPHM